MKSNVTTIIFVININFDEFDNCICLLYCSAVKLRNLRAAVSQEARMSWEEFKDTHSEYATDESLQRFLRKLLLFICLKFVLFPILPPFPKCKLI